MVEAAEPPKVDRILVELAISAPADAVWEALRDPDKIYNWFGWDALTLKEEIDFIFVKGGRADESARILRFEGVSDRFEVEGDGKSSILRVVRSVSPDEEWDGVYDGMVEGWIGFVQQLRLAMERHDLGERRTLYFSGDAKSGGSGPIAALGLSELRDRRDGEPFEARLPTGDHLQGEKYFETEWQVGLTAPGWGDGLLIVSDMSIKEDAPHGRGMVILTTYDLSEQDFDDLRARWTGWWNDHYRTASGDGCS